MRDPSYRAPGTAGSEMRPPGPDEPLDVTRDTKAFTAAIRTRVFAFLRSWSIGSDEAALALLDSSVDAAGESWTGARLRALREAHRLERGGLRLDPEARNLRHTSVAVGEDRSSWRVQQMLIDPAGLNDWVAEVDVDLTASRVTGEPVVQLVRLGALVES